jgi:putative peptidoglycan lipid II flippase
MPAISAAADDENTAGVRTQMSRGLRLTFVFLVPAALGLAALANPIVTASLQHGSTTASAGRVLADTLTVFAVGLPAFSAFQLLLRGFYARQDSRTPTLINVVVNVVNIVADLILIAVLPDHLRLPGLAAGLALSYVVGTGIAFVMLRGSLGGADGARVVRLLVRTTLAALGASAVARALSDLIRNALGIGTAAAIAAVLVAGSIGIAVYVWAGRRMRIRELTDLLRVARGRR